MKKSILPILLLFFVSVLFAQDTELLFEKGNTSYREGLYEEALLNYQKLDSLGLQSADLYYNLGNTYYKLNQIANTIYYFEKALWLDPNHEDAKHNLVFAQRMTIDAFESLPKSIFQKFNEQVIYPISHNVWAWLSVGFAFLIAIFFLIYYFSVYASKKRLFFTLSSINLLLFLFTLSFSVKAKHYNNTDQPAIVFSQKVAVKAEPTQNATEVFVLHEGTKVLILENIDNWYQIKLIDGKTGWLPSTSLRIIKS